MSWDWFAFYHIRVDRELWRFLIMAKLKNSRYFRLTFSDLGERLLEELWSRPGHNDRTHGPRRGDCTPSKPFLCSSRKARRLPLSMPWHIQISWSCTLGKGRAATHIFLNEAQFPRARSKQRASNRDILGSKLLGSKRPGLSLHWDVPSWVRQHEHLSPPFFSFFLFLPFTISFFHALLGDFLGALGWRVVGAGHPWQPCVTCVSFPFYSQPLPSPWGLDHSRSIILPEPKRQIGEGWRERRKVWEVGYVWYFVLKYCYK